MLAGPGPVALDAACAAHQAPSQRIPKPDKRRRHSVPALSVGPSVDSLGSRSLSMFCKARIRHVGRCVSLHKNLTLSIFPNGAPIVSAFPPAYVRDQDHEVRRLRRRKRTEHGPTFDFSICGCGGIDILLDALLDLVDLCALLAMFLAVSCAYNVRPGSYTALGEKTNMLTWFCMAEESRCWAKTVMKVDSTARHNIGWRSLNYAEEQGVTASEPRGTMPSSLNFLSRPLHPDLRHKLLFSR